MIKPNQVAKDVRVKFNSNFQIKSLSDKYLACEPILYIAENHVYNDWKGYYVIVRGGSHTNSGTAYLDELDLEFSIGEQPLYSHETIDYNQDLSRFKSHL